MPRIDSDTVNKILDAADIVEVVSDFVHLQRRGANYIGLCPFHNERTPSFSVSKSKGICKCFSCGKGGSAVNFIMLHEQMTYQEALRYLAKKYNIEIVEKELTPQEREQATERESMLAANEFALQHFQHNLTETLEGQNIGLAYFRQRGINDEMVSKFKLGYSIDKRDDLLKAAVSKGYKEKYLLETGLIGKSEKGEYYDRFRGRVIYPVASISGKIVAFGGRILRSDKPGGKYVNSPESIIYRKSYELYGLYQAKSAIVKRNKCILVEGYMDVISMHQKGIENVVASSGTSLTEGQIRLIHRFTDNITVIYDADAAGIKASLRGIDMILAEGMNVKVLQLPPGDDPDSYSQTHSSTEVEEYLATHEIDFIKFKINILLEGVGNDPIQRAKVVSDIVKSIAVIPDEIARASYIKECSFTLSFDEKILSNEVAKVRSNILEQEFKKTKAEEAKKIFGEDNTTDTSGNTTQPDGEPKEGETETDTDTTTNVLIEGFLKKDRSQQLKPYEEAILRYVVKYGFGELKAGVDKNGQNIVCSVVDYIRTAMEHEKIRFSITKYQHVFDAVLSLRNSWETERVVFNKQALSNREKQWIEGENDIRLHAQTLEEIERKEKELLTKCDEDYYNALLDFDFYFVERKLVSSPDDEIRNITTDLVTEKYQLSKIHTKYANIPEERDTLNELLPRAIFELENAILELDIKDLNDGLKAESSKPSPDSGLIVSIMTKILEKQELKKEYAKYLGDRVITPLSKI